MGDHLEENVPQNPNESEKTRFGIAPDTPAEFFDGSTDDSGQQRASAALTPRFGMIPPTQANPTARSLKTGQFRFEGTPETDTDTADSDRFTIRSETVYSHAPGKSTYKPSTLFFAIFLRTLQVVAILLVFIVLLGLGAYFVLYDSFYPKPRSQVDPGSSHPPTTVRFFDLSASGRRFVFLMDTTEHMEVSTGASDFLLIKSNFQQSLRDLREIDFFEFFDFHSQNPATFSQEGAATLVPADLSHLSQAREKIEKIRPRGTGDLKRLILAALATQPDTLFLVCHSYNAEQFTVAVLEEIRAAAGGTKLYAVEIADTIKPLDETPLEKLSRSLHGDYQWLNILGKTFQSSELSMAQKMAYESTSIPPLTEMIEADFRFTDDVSRPVDQRNSPFGKEIVTNINRLQDGDSLTGSPKQLSLADSEILEIEADARIVYMSGFTGVPQSPPMLRVGAENRLALWVRGANAELPAAEYLIGLCYKNGVRVTSDGNKAFQCQLKAALQGCQPAMFLVAAEYKIRSDTNPSDHDAIAYAKYWAERGSRLGEPLAQCFWANHFTNTPEERYSWLRKAADQGLPEAQFLVGKCFETGNGTHVDKYTAANWYEKAAKQGFVAAQMALEKLKADQAADDSE